MSIISLTTGSPNSLDSCDVGIMTWYPDELVVGVRTPTGERITQSLKIGQELPLMKGWTLLYIVTPPAALPGEVPERVGARRAVAEVCPTREYDTIRTERALDIMPGMPQERVAFLADFDAYARAFPLDRDDSETAMDAGGNPAQALSRLSGTPGHQATCWKLPTEQLLGILGGNAVSVVASNLFTQRHQFASFAAHVGIYSDLAYAVKGLDGVGRIELHNPWGYDHPRALTLDEFLKLFIGIYWID